MKIAFTGHRDKYCLPSQLVQLRFDYPNAIWGHGNAKSGFDKQVDNFAISDRIPCVRFDPRSEVIAEKGYVKALLERDLELVDWLAPTLSSAGDNILVALWDGRKTGGTYYTKTYAGKYLIEIREWKP